MTCAKVWFWKDRALGPCTRNTLGKNHSTRGQRDWWIRWLNHIELLNCLQAFHFLTFSSSFPKRLDLPDAYGWVWRRSEMGFKCWVPRWRRYHGALQPDAHRLGTQISWSRADRWKSFQACLQVLSNPWMMVSCLLMFLIRKWFFQHLPIFFGVEDAVSTNHLCKWSEGPFQASSSQEGGTPLGNFGVARPTERFTMGEMVKCMLWHVCVASCTQNLPIHQCFVFNDGILH